MLNLGSKLCASSTGTALALMACDGASVWKMQDNGQIQIGGKCLSQLGVAAGEENVAVRAAVVASSSADAVSHGAASAVDADETTFWASRPGVEGPTTLTLDLGEARSLSSAKIVWGFPAEDFEFASSVDGQHWTVAYSTTSNMVNVSRVPLGQVTASHVRITMHKPHPVYGVFSGKPVFGIVSLAVFAPRLTPMLEDCGSAAASEDARDKYFATGAPAFDASAAADLASELPALTAAKASLSVALGELVAAVAAGCGKHPSFAAARGAAMQAHESQSGSWSHDSDLEGARLLWTSARSAILSARESSSNKCCDRQGGPDRSLQLHPCAGVQGL